MTRTTRRLVVWGGWTLGSAAALLGLYLSVFLLPYPLFPHHVRRSGFSVFSDREIPESFGPVLDGARRRVEAMPLYRGERPPRIFVCTSRRRFALLCRLAGARHPGQGLLISAAGNAFLSQQGIESVARRNPAAPPHSRLEGSWSAAIAHEVAHQLLRAELGSRGSRRVPAWKSEGWADYAANLSSAAADPDYDLRRRVGLLLADDRWQRPTGTVDRRHFRWHLLVEYLCTVRGLDLDGLLAEGVTEGGTLAEMTAWFERPGTGGTGDGRNPLPPSP